MNSVILVVVVVAASATFQVVAAQPAKQLFDEGFKSPLCFSWFGTPQTSLPRRKGRTFQITQPAVLARNLDRGNQVTHAESRRYNTDRPYPFGALHFSH